MEEVVKAAEAGKPVLGVCNGFQILLEAGLLPGAMRRNESLTFICKPVELKVENNQTMFITALFTKAKRSPFQLHMVKEIIIVTKKP